jgi:hypothetical protein
MRNIPLFVSTNLSFCIISINVVTLLHYILTNFALLEYPVLEYVLTIKVNCNAVDVCEIYNSFYIIWNIFVSARVTSLYILFSWKMATPLNSSLFSWLFHIWKLQNCLQFLIALECKRKVWCCKPECVKLMQLHSQRHDVQH